MQLDLNAYVEHAICNEILFLSIYGLGICFANLAMIDVAKPGVIPVVSATMGEAAHLVCTDSYGLGEPKLLNNNCRIAKSAYN